MRKKPSLLIKKIVFKILLLSIYSQITFGETLPTNKQTNTNCPCEFTGFLKEVSWDIVCIIPPYTRREAFFYEKKSLQFIEASNEGSWFLTFYKGEKVIINMEFKRFYLDLTEKSMRCSVKDKARYEITQGRYFNLQ